MTRREKQNYEISHIDRTRQDPGVYKMIQNPLLIFESVECKVIYVELV